MKQYVNIKIVETKKQKVKSSKKSNSPVCSMKVIQHEILLVEAPVSWYGHELTDTPDNAVIFPDLKTSTAISTEPGKMFLEGWVDGKRIFEVPLVVRTEEEKSYEAPSSETDELVPVMELVFIQNLIMDLEEESEKVFLDEEPGPFDDLLIDTDDDPKMGYKLFFSSTAGRMDLKFSSKGKETVFESFKSKDKFDNFIYALNTATDIALKD